MDTPSRREQLYQSIAANYVPFLAVFFVVVFWSYAFLYVIDFIPESPQEVAEATGETEATSGVFSSISGWVSALPSPVPNDGLRPATVAAPADNLTRVVIPETEPAVVNDPYPNRIIIDALNKEIPVLNPQSRAVADLDAALLNGVVRHPDSADFSEEGNMLILGHSSYLPNVLNRHFQAFNGIQELTWGDLIRVQSGETEYVYRVDRVYEALASEVVVEPRWGTPMLTLATCDSFGSKDDRFIVEASLVSSTPL
jgi:LPXTG-site transpeptidase (sortase) family protein